MPVLGQIWPFLGLKFIFWDGVKLLVSLYQGTNEIPFPFWKHWPVRFKLVARDENVQFWPKNLDIWGEKSIILYGDCDICQKSILPVCPGLQLSVSELWVIFRGSPLFLVVLGNSQITIISTLNFGLFSTQTQNDKGPGPGQNYGETAVYTFSQKVFFWEKSILSQKNTQNLLRDWYLFWKRQLFYLNNFFRSWPEHG